MANNKHRSHKLLLILTVHGIRTFGQWQARLEQLIRAHLDESRFDWSFKHKKYQFFSVFKFINPLTRRAEVVRFRDELVSVLKQTPADAIYVVAHSFGTHLAANAIRELPEEYAQRIRLVIFAGSVLHENWCGSATINPFVFKVPNLPALSAKALKSRRWSISGGTRIFDL